MSALISIVIPTYNRAADLRRALASVIEQTWRNWEVWVVDNHSSDNTAEVVESFRDSRIHLLSVHNHGVIAVSRNLGVAHACGEHVAFLDSDDWWQPRKLECSARELSSGADVVYHDLCLAKSTSRPWRMRRAATRPLIAPVLADLMEHGNALVNSSVVVRRSVLLDAGGLSEDRRVASWEDYELWLRLARLTDRFTRINEPLGCYWAGGGNTTSPERTIRNLGHLREMYFLPAGRGQDADLPAWYHYNLGRAHYLLKGYPDALKHLGFAMRGALPSVVRLKAFMTFADAWARQWSHPHVNR